LDRYHFARHNDIVEFNSKTLVSKKKITTRCNQAGGKSAKFHKLTLIGTSIPQSMSIVTSRGLQTNALINFNE
jgi:hypothetical protein